MKTSDPEITAAEAAALEASDQKRPFMDKETMQAYNEYLKDWRWNMSTHVALQRQYIGRRYSPRTDNLF